MFQIISDGGCDFTDKELAESGVVGVPFYISFDDKTYMKEGVEISKEAFFQRLSTEKKLFPKTAQPNPGDYIDAFTPFLKEGKDIICLTISSSLSGSLNSVRVAMDMLKEDYPDRKIVAIDSKGVSVGQNLILREIIKMRDAGLDLDQVEEKILKVVETARIYFIVDTLDYLKKGGRIGPTTAFVGGILGLCPILRFVDGKAEQMDSVRGKKNALKLFVEAGSNALKGNLNKANAIIGHISSQNDADNFKAGLEAELSAQLDNPIVNIGAAIGVHAGPGALAFAYCKKYDAV